MCIRDSLEGGDSRLNILLSGFWADKYYGKNSIGSYNTSEEYDDDFAWHFTFAKEDFSMISEADPKQYASSCRYIKDVKNKKTTKKKKTKTVQQTSIANPITDVFTDPRDGQTYKTVQLKDGKIWMAQNFNFELPKEEVETGFIFKTKKEEAVCWQYDDSDKNGKKYGRLYTWDAALKACPEGWHLPSDEEWKNMIRCYGGENFDSPVNRELAYKALRPRGVSKFAVQYAGLRINEEFKFIKDFGDYWCSKEFDSRKAYYFSFLKGLERIDGETYDKSFGLSCRYIKD